MQLYFSIRAFLIVFIVCNLTPSQAVSQCSSPSKYHSFEALVIETCTGEQYQWVLQQSTCKECMYTDSQGRKAIGVDFHLEDTDAKSILASVGADYDDIVKGATTDIETPCRCAEVVCLNQSQIEDIFEESIANTIATVKRTIPVYESLCCAARAVVVDIAFALGDSTLSTYKPLFSWLEIQNWQAASDYLRTTKWCRSGSSRCASDADVLHYNGCPCSGQFPVSCYGVNWSCCQKDQSCCNASVPINNIMHQEMLCCPYQNGSCCGDAHENKCCPEDYPHPCQTNNNCCGRIDHCGNDGNCYTERGIPAPSAKAKSLIFPEGT